MSWSFLVCSWLQYDLPQTHFRVHCAADVKLQVTEAGEVCPPTHATQLALPNCLTHYTWPRCTLLTYMGIFFYIYNGEEYSLAINSESRKGHQ